MVCTLSLWGKMQKSNNRLARINEELKREISNIINYELKNSKVTGMISITKVKITPGKIKQTQNSNPNKTRQMFLLGDLRNQIFF